ncbi:MAG: hypothetical protein WC758_03100 [Candidatus Woesearchaeota archaeon]|jgi:hypothetical protein
MKKGDLSINIIIVAAIALIILVILSVLIFGTGGDIRKSTACEGIGGNCYGVDSCSENNDDVNTYIRHPTARCSIEGDICCVRQ